MARFKPDAELVAECYVATPERSNMVPRDQLSGLQATVFSFGAF